MTRRFSNQEHWLMFSHDKKSRKVDITGCHCGFRADVDSDTGYGDSVVDHIANVVERATLKKVLVALDNTPGMQFRDAENTVSEMLTEVEKE